MESASGTHIVEGGWICENHTEMLVITKQISCEVKPNKEKIDKVILVHIAEERTIWCQAYKNNKPLISHYYFVMGDEKLCLFQHLVNV